MSAFGMIDAMKKSYEQNRALLKRKSTFEILKERGFKTNNKKLIIKKASPECISRLREKLQAENRRNLKKRLFVLFLITLMVVIPVVYYFFIYQVN